MNLEFAFDEDRKILDNLLAAEPYKKFADYDVKFGLFRKYAKLDKDGNIKTPAIVKNGQSVPAEIKLVSAFNRITDDIDVKIILNSEQWDDLKDVQKKAVIENMLAYLEIKTDKDGEPLTVSDSCDKILLKLKKPDFYCEGFLGMIVKYGDDYLPLGEAKSIVDFSNSDGRKEDAGEIPEEEEEEKPVKKPAAKSAKKAPEPDEKPAEESVDLDSLVDGVI